ncbi:MAG: hypothetical protein ACOZE5_07755 [Verrucomicrobiota bacterium]
MTAIPPIPSAPVSAAGFARGTMIALVLLAAGYLVQVASPLRLNHDAVRLLSMARAAHETGSYLVDGRMEQYPTGYPAMVRLLLGAGLGRTVWLNLLNLLWLAAALTGWYWIGRRQAGLSPPAARLAVCLPLLSWVLVKHAVIPLTDLPYLGLSTFALLFLQRYWAATPGPAWRDLGLAWLFALAALQVRTIGLALIAAVGVSTLCHPTTLRHIPARLLPSPKVLCAGGALAGLLFVLLAQSDRFHARFTAGYFPSLLAFLRGETAVTPGDVLVYRLSELASLLLNLPLPAGLRLPAAALGLAGLGLLLAAARRWWQRHRPWLIYAGCYAGILVFWPFTDPRFLLPLLPLGGLLVVDAGQDFVVRSRRRQWLAGAGLAAYLVLGLAALGYSTRLSLAGTGFARLYGLPDAQATYAHAFGLPPLPDSPPPHAGWLELLREFEPRAAALRASPSPKP